MDGLAYFLQRSLHLTQTVQNRNIKSKKVAGNAGAI